MCIVYRMDEICILHMVLTGRKQYDYKLSNRYSDEYRCMAGKEYEMEIFHSRAVMKCIGISILSNTQQKYCIGSVFCISIRIEAFSSFQYVLNIYSSRTIY